MDVALGKIDTIDVMGSNHLANMPLWYRLLNCGFRIPASAGTDCFLNRIPSRLPGSDRAYVHVEGEFSYGRWIESLKAGRSFVTSGPILSFSVDGLALGETLRLDAPREVHLQGQVSAQFPLGRIEVVHNGDVVAEAAVTGDGHTVTLDQRIALDRSGWLALRAEVARTPNLSGGSGFGHTSPIYVEVAGRPLDSRADAEYFLAWIDRLWAEVRQRNRIPARHQVGVESQVSAARAVFQRLAGR
jgi:hypothetical protein